MSEVRDRSQEDPMPEGRQPRGVTPRPRSGTAAGRSFPHAPRPEAMGSGWEEQPTPLSPRPRAAVGEEQPHVQGAVAARPQEGLEELSHTEG